MELNTPDYKGRERRTNGRLRLTFMDWRWIISTVVILIVSGAIGWTTLKADVEHIEENAEELEEKHDEDVKEINTSLKTLIELVQIQAVMNGKMQTIMQYIQKDVEEIKNNK